jgi:predicted alpha/beta-fold hydrolase
MESINLPPFRPLPWLRNRHLQTLAAFWLPAKKMPYAARPHYVILPDGDRIVLHDDCPAHWRRGGPTALLLHGICGSHRSAYLERAAAKLHGRGVRVFRMDQRGCGSARGLARRPYHAGCTSDLDTALRHVGRLCPASPTTVVGFSLGGNIALKLAGENSTPGNLTGVMAISPPIDLTVSARALRGFANRLYDRYFAKVLGEIAAGLLQPIELPRFRCLHEFNEFFFTRVWNFGTLEKYYRLCSAARYLHAVRVPTLVVTAADDPLVPVQSFLQARLSSSTRLVVTDRGGHMGFIGKARPADPDRFWIDWRVVDWVTRAHPPRVPAMPTGLLTGA